MNVGLSPRFPIQRGAGRTRYVGLPFQFGQAQQLDGSTQYLSLSPALLPNAAAFPLQGSLSVWFNTDAGASPNGVLFASSTSATYNRMLVYTHAPSSQLYVDLASPANSSTYTIAFSPGYWGHLALTWDQHQPLLNIYLNGQLMLRANPLYWPTLYTLFNFGSNGLYFFKGLVDELAYWDGYSLQPTEVLTLYNLGKGNGSPPATGLVGYWPLNDRFATGGHLYTSELTGSGLHLQLVPSATPPTAVPHT